jgi:hypothetical protein
MREIELRITLDSTDGDRLVGHLLSPTGEERHFDGWLGLISALDAELSPAGLDPPTPGTGSRAGSADVDESQREDSGGANE